MLVEAIILKGVEGNSGLKDIFKVDKAEQVLPSAHGRLLDEADALEARKGTEDVYISATLRLTSRSEASLGMPSTYRLLVASLGMWKRAIEVFCWGGGYMD